MAKQDEEGESPLTRIRVTLGNIKSAKDSMENWERGLVNKEITNYQIFIDKQPLEEERKREIKKNLEDLSATAYKEPKTALGQLLNLAEFHLPEIENAKRDDEAKERRDAERNTLNE